MNGLNSNKKEGDYLKRIRLIYISLVVMIFLLTLVSFLLVYYGARGIENNALAMEWLRILLLAVPISMTTGYIIFWIKLKRMLPGETIANKLQRYFAAATLRMIFFGIPGLLLSVAALVTAQLLFLAIVPFILLVFLLARPFRSAIADELKLSPGERLTLEKIET